MAASADGEITSLLNRMSEGDRDAERAVIPLIYGEMHQIARRVHEGGAEQSLQATDLVDEVYLRLLGSDHRQWDSRRHFLCEIVQVMRSVIVDHIRRKTARKRRPDGEQLPLDSLVCAYEDRSIDVLALDDALSRLAERDDVRARIVELHFFGGQTIGEIADVLGLSKRDTERKWTLSRAWLRRELGDRS